MRLLSRCSRCTLAFLVVALSACGDDQGHTSPTETVAPTIAALALSGLGPHWGGEHAAYCHDRQPGSRQAERDR